MHQGLFSEMHRPCICEDGISVLDLFPGCFFYNLIGKKDPIPNVIVDRVTQRILGL